MDNNLKNMLIILIAIVLVVVVIRRCQRVKDVKITQKGNENSSKFAVEVKKEKE